MKRFNMLTIWLVGLTALPGSLLAHPGHHHDMTAREVSTHLLSDPWHVALLVLAALAAGALAFHSWRKRGNRS
ncbi:MAG: hypothetical protein AAGB27_01165 [Pseudomonadota bacterium]